MIIIHTVCMTQAITVIELDLEQMRIYNIYISQNNVLPRSLFTLCACMTQAITVIELDLEQMRTAASAKQTRHAHSPRLHLLSHGDVKTMLRHRPSQLRHLFPEERVLLQWCPLRLMEANTAEIFNGQQAILASAPSGPIQPAESPGDKFPVTLMSAGGHYPCQRGRNYDVDMFGAGSEEELRAHLEWHVLRLAELGSESSAVLRVYYSARLDHIVAELQREFPIKPSDIPFRKVFVLEMDYVKG